MMIHEYITDKNPTYVPNRHTTYENTVLQEHAAIVSGLRNTDTDEAIVESQGRLLIGMCLKERAHQFIEDNYQKYYDEEYKKLNDYKTDDAKHNACIHRAWLRLINEAITIFINKYKVDGSKAKIAVMDYETFDGKAIVELSDDNTPIGFTEDEDGL